MKNLTHPKFVLVGVGISVAALVVSIAGFSFVASSTMEATALRGQNEALESKFSTLDTNSKRFALSVREALNDKQKSLDKLRAEVTELRVQSAQASKAAQQRANDQVTATRDAEYGKALAAKEKRPLSNGISPQFDSLFRQRIASVWVNPSPKDYELDADDQVVVVVAMARDGSITDVGVASTSGVAFFDESVRKAVLTVGRIPEVARVTDQDYLIFRQFRFAFTPANFLPKKS